MLSIHSDEHFMRQALIQAQIAFEEDEVPVGAVIVSNGQIIARAYNQTEKLNDVTAHAEILAYTSAANYLGGKYLRDCTLYVTMEPCTMCAGALFWSQISKVVFGAYDEKRGAMRLEPVPFHPKTKIIGGVMAEECGDIVKEFFKYKRK